MRYHLAIPGRTWYTRRMAAKKDTRDPVFSLRMDPKLRAALQLEADAERRTLAAHIIYLLESHPGRKKMK